MAECDCHEWVDTREEHDNFRETSNVMIDETSSVDIAKFGVLLAIEFDHQEAFEDVEANQEVDDQRYGENESRIRSKYGDGFVDQFSDMGPMWRLVVNFSWCDHDDLCGVVFQATCLGKRG